MLLYFFFFLAAGSRELGPVVFGSRELGAGGPLSLAAGNRGLNLFFGEPLRCEQGGRVGANPY